MGTVYQIDYDYHKTAVTSITDEIYNKATGTPFYLGVAPRNFFTDNVTFQIWTGAGKTGTKLVENTDFTLTSKNKKLSNATGKEVKNRITLINYGLTDLYFNYDVVASEVGAARTNDLQSQIDTNVAGIAANAAAISALSTGIYPEIYNCEISNNTTDSSNDIDIAAGFCYDSTLTESIILSSGLTKQLDVSWAAGTNAGGLFTGSMAASTTYHVFLIRKDSDGSIDAGFDTSVTAANIPAGYTAYRRIGSIMTDAVPAIIQFIHTWQDKTFIITERINTATSVSIDTTAGGTLYTFDVPLGINVKLIATLHSNMSNGGISSAGADETAVISGAISTSNFLGDFYAYNTGGYITGNASILLPFHKTNTSGQIKLIRLGSYFSGDLTSYNTVGWIDYTL